MKEYTALSAPIQIGSITVKNRIFMAPMDTGFGTDSHGVFTKEGIGYFVRRAAGGFGLLVSEGTMTEGDCILQHRSEFLEAGRTLNQRLHAYGTKMLMQLSAGVGRNAGQKSPSPLPALGNPSLTTQELTKEEIHEKVRAIGQAALLAKEAGFAGVEIHALHWGHLLDEFALSFMNHRTDEYGGSLENRLRICREIREEIAAVCGKDFPVTMRLAVKSYMKDFDTASFDGSEEVGRTAEEAVETAKLLEAFGYDGLSTDAGTLDAFYIAEPPAYVPMGFTLDIVKKVKAAVSIPVFAGARMADPDLDEAAVESGTCDAVVIGRQALADPDFAGKVTAGRTKEIRPCIGCNQGCIWGYFRRGRVSCAVNPEVGREAACPITPAPQKKKVAVVGGGVAGMEAARISALRGHDVTLYEKSGELGGNLLPAGAHDFKKEVAKLNDYYKAQLQELPVRVQMNTEATPEMLRREGADAVILAAGSTPVMPGSIPGIDHPKAVSCVDALLNRKPIGDTVVIVGGGLVGCETALGYAMEGKHVTIVEALDQLMKTGDVPAMNRQMLLDAFACCHVRILTGTRLAGIQDEGALLLLPDGNRELVSCDNVILSIGYRPRKSMAEELQGCGAAVFEIGDGAGVGNILSCIRDAYEVTHNL
ncbi:MAG: FAD-dependent oxidoreductase [Lachnospiraceae bacterium]